jgi:16S rRNA (guanine527-N7)-methyltransferase
MTPTPPITAAAVAGRLAAQDLRVTPEQAEKLAVYLEVLAVWNRRVNLVGPSDWTVVLDELVADSPHLAAFSIPLRWRRFSGRRAASPCVWTRGRGRAAGHSACALVWPRGDYAMIEVRAKRAVFLNEALARLGLSRPRCFRAGPRTPPARLASPDRPGTVDVPVPGLSALPAIFGLRGRPRRPLSAGRTPC